ncbi:MAG: SCO family protein [Candidatus Methylacidiphilales bacterium]
MESHEQSVPPRPKRIMWLFGALVVVMVGFNIFYGFYVLNKGRKPDISISDGAVRKHVPTFSLTDQRGQTLGSEDLEGKVWVAAFIFTRCPGPCPLISQNMKALFETFRAEKDFRLVSFSLDPEHDTPEVLTVYAGMHGADPEQWHFLTGSREVIHTLSVEGFYSAVVKTEPDQVAQLGPVIHGTRLAIVDRDGQWVAAFDATTPEGIARAEQKIRELLKD